MTSPGEPVLDVYVNGGKYVVICHACFLGCIRRSTSIRDAIVNTGCMSLSGIQRTIEASEEDGR